MKSYANRPFHSRRKERRSAALIIMLCVLVILAAVLVAFMNSAKTELISSKLYADNGGVHTLMNTCVNIVMTQIRQATTATPTDCWTSQPGLIRTFNNSGEPDMSYKLYSSDVMQTNVALNPATEAAALASWSTQPAVFTDLNDPVGGVYPIVDPAATTIPVQGFSIDTTAPTTSTQAAPMPVKWLYVLSNGILVAPVVAGSGTTATIAGATTSNPIVGRVAFWTDDETCKVNINTASEQGSFNGQAPDAEGTNTVAWATPHFDTSTDYNLAEYQPVENEFQNYPGHPAEVSLSSVFPGLVIPGAAAVKTDAFNAFYAIAPRIQSGGSFNGTVPSSTSSTTNTAIVNLDGDRLYDSVDELLFNTNSTADTPPLREGNPTPNTANNWTVPPEPLTQTQLEQTQFFLTAHSRAPETTLFGTPKIACWPISAFLPGNPSTPYASAFDRLIAFCSTLGGNASTVGGSSTTAAGGANQQIYYFQRQNKDSQTFDYANIPRNQTLYSYLQTLMGTNVPGFGGTLATKFGADTNQILTEIFDYIRSTNLNDLNLPTTTAPGFPSSYQYGGGNEGVGEVAPITITSNNTRGFGRFTTVSEAALWLICTADPVDTVTNSTTNGYGHPYTDGLYHSNNAGTLPITIAGKTIPGSPGNLTLPYLQPLTSTPLPPTATATTKQLRIEAMLVLDPFTPMQAIVPIRPDIDIYVKGLDSWTLNGTNLGFPSYALQTGSSTATGYPGVYQLGVDPGYWGIASEGGYMGTSWALEKRCLAQRNGTRLPQDANFNSSNQGGDPLNEQYPFVSQPITVSGVSQTNPTLSFSGGTITVYIQQRTTGTIQSSAPGTPGATIQTLTIKFPATTMPAPTLVAPTISSYTTVQGLPYANYTGGAWTFQVGGAGTWTTNLGTTPNIWQVTTASTTGRLVTAGNTPTPVLALKNDVIYSMVPAQNGQNLDPRFVALTGVSGAGSGTDTTGALFSPHPWYIPNGTSTAEMAHTMIAVNGNGIAWFPTGTPVNAATSPNGGNALAVGAGVDSWKNWPCPKVPYPAPDAMANGDWDNGIGLMEDGGFINEPDQGSIQWVYGNAYPPYFAVGSENSINFTSPSRLMPSPGMFGSLPTTFARSQAGSFGGSHEQGWQTLLFRRQPTHPDYLLGDGNYPYGGNLDPDYLMMDLFWMPVVEPYAISEMLSTAGKINMNYQIIPFTYIKRQTGLYAVLKHENVVAVPTTDLAVYKGLYSTAPTQHNYRLPIQIAPTLAQFDNRFANNDDTGLFAYRTPAEICDINLIPYDTAASPNPGTTLSATSSDSTIDATMASYWTTHSLTGDNCRELPYTTIYPKLTTRSNTFRVHYRVQVLKKLPGSAPNVWTEGSDLVTSEGRGSVLLERYLDASDTTIPDYAANPATIPTLESHYQFRVVSINRFPP